MKRIVICALGALLLVGCASKGPSASHSQKWYVTNDHEQGLTSVPGSKFNHTLIASVDNYIGTRAGGDCSGFITVLNSKHDELFFSSKDLPKYFTNGRKSQAIYNYYSRKNLLSDTPRIGDLVFFQNTLRSNKGKINNEISHIGVVREIYADGRVKFVHNTRGRNQEDFVNLNKKNVHVAGKKMENSYIVRCSKDRISCLASNRFAGYGRVNN